MSHLDEARISFNCCPPSHDKICSGIIILISRLLINFPTLFDYFRSKNQEIIRKTKGDRDRVLSCLGITVYNLITFKCVYVQYNPVHSLHTKEKD